MQFIKSLFCLRGSDNRSRFFAISCAIYSLFLILISTLTGRLVISITILVLFSVLIALTSLRRLRDANLNNKLLYVPCLVFSAAGLIIIFSEQAISYYLIIVALLCSAVLLTYPSNRKQTYILGYFGPVDLTEYLQDSNLNNQTKYRVEPTLVSNSGVNLDKNEHASLQINEVTAKEQAKTSDSYQKQNDIGEVIRLNLQNNKQIQLGIAATLTLITIILLTFWIINRSETKEEILIDVAPQHQTSIAIATPTRNHALSMPDNYTLYLSDHEGISINWQADEVSESTLWSQLTAQGDESCKEISFNKGDSIRTLSVQVSKNDATNYFANFSPLDSKALIQALAFRGTFSLCGYNFSLKGSQAALGKNSRYAQWLEY